MALPRTSSGTPSVALTKWLGTMWPVRENQNADSPVSTLPLSGIGFGCTTSYVEIRSEATIRRRSPRSYISRTFPDARSGRSATVVTAAMLAAGYVALPYCAICPRRALISRPACRLTRGMFRSVPVLLALLAFAAPASANRFVVAHDGALPDVAVG